MVVVVFRTRSTAASVAAALLLAASHAGAMSIQSDPLLRLVQSEVCVRALQQLQLCDPAPSPASHAGPAIVCM